MTFNNKSRDPGSVNSSAPPSSICDYEGSPYQTDFWTQDRAYEDAVERIALKAMLPPSGHRLIEIGAGFGRLADLYSGYDEVILFDYSRSMLKEARANRGTSGPSGRPRYLFVAGDFYSLPFVAGLFNTATMVRVIHHAQKAPRVLRHINEILAPGGTFVLEFANKRNLKAIARWLTRRQSWSPFDPEPYEFIKLNFDFHPHWVRSQLEQSGFSIQAQRTVSHFRLGFLKRFVPSQFLSMLDALLQPTGRWWQLTPSVFVKSIVSHSKPSAHTNTFFRCPACGNARLIAQSSALACANCSAAWSVRDGIYDFKNPI
jgi:ubiquinone/menaquinone biosynthesis C-methylase UbiE